MAILEIIGTGLTAIASLLAAWFWFRAATATVSDKEAHSLRKQAAKDDDGWESGSITIIDDRSPSEGWDLTETLALQSSYNRKGALCAGLAALVQSAIFAADFVSRSF